MLSLRPPLLSIAQCPSQTEDPLPFVSFLSLRLDLAPNAPVDPFFEAHRAAFGQQLPLRCGDVLLGSQVIDSQRALLPPALDEFQQGNPQVFLGFREVVLRQVGEPSLLRLLPLLRLLLLLLLRDHRLGPGASAPCSSPAAGRGSADEDDLVLAFGCRPKLHLAADPALDPVGQLDLRRKDVLPRSLD